MGLCYHRAGTQYLLMTAQVSVEEYSAANHMGEPGKLQIRQPRLLDDTMEWRCHRKWASAYAAIRQQVI